MEAALKAISEPRRRAILTLVWDAERSAGDIAAHFDDVTRTAISQHLTVLKGAGLIEERREGTKRLYRARPEGLGELREWLSTFWDRSLGDLKAAAEAEARRRGGRRTSDRS